MSTSGGSLGGSTMVGGGGGSMSQSYSYSSSSSGGGGGGSVGVGAGGIGVGSSGMSVSMGGVSGGGGGYAMARKTNVQRSSGGGAAASGNSMMMALSALGGGTASYAGTHELAENPKAVIQRRDREKHDINDLNVKLAEYIESNGWYRIKVKEQEKLILKMKGEFESIEARLRQIYDVEMANLRATIDATAKEKAVVELKVETLEQLYKDFRTKYEAELSAHESTRARLPRLEKEISEKDAQIDFLAKTLSSLEPQVSALKAQISTYQKEAIEAKMGVDGEIGRRVELESKLQTKDEEIAFLKKVYEEKLRMALDFDMDSEASYSNDLAEALKDIRAEYQAQLEAIRGGEDDAWFQSKISTLMATSDKQRGELQMARDEVVKVKARMTEAATSTGTLNGQIAALKAQISEMSADFENQKKLHAVSLAERDAMIAEYKKQCAAYILELKGLMDIKLSLDEEIGTYRRLLLAGGSEIKVAGGGGGATITAVSGGTVSSGVVSSGFSSSSGGMTVHGGGVAVGGGGVAVGGGGVAVGGGGVAVGGGGGSSMTMSSSSSTVTSVGFGAQVSAAEKAYYQNIFTMFDRSGDGRIDGAELKALFDAADASAFGGRAKRNATESYCKSLMSTADSDGSGKLSFDEFLRLMIFEKKIFLKNAFKAHDVGGKGYLTDAEVLATLEAAGYDVSSDAARALVAGARGGADGRINYTEFVMNL